MKHWSLRVKITLLVAIILTLACVVITANSIYSAQGYYSVLDNGAQIEAIPEGEMTIPDNISPYSAATRQFSIQSVVVMTASVLCSIFLTYWLTGRLLRPLTELTHSIRHIDQGELHRRAELQHATGEVRNLTKSFNAMLDRLEDSFMMQKNFAANAAHELKTPIAVLKTSLQVLEIDDKPNIEDYREFTAAAKTSIDRLIGTVDALMALAMSDRSENTENVAIRPLLELIFSELSPRAEKGGVSLILSGDSPLVNGEQTLLYRALFNLVENAIKYNRPDGRVTVHLSQIGERAQIQVTDTGIGMSSETVSHVFEPFYRADHSRSQRIPGSGLGLSVVKAIVERQHGSISLDSSKDVGTTVTLIL